MTPERVHVRLAERSYDIMVGSDNLAEIGPFAMGRSRGNLAFLVTDSNVAPHALQICETLRCAGLQAELEILGAGEQRKSLQTAERLYDRLMDFHADRKSMIIPVGGGVIGDLAGFVAATYARGVPMLMVPTTLLAMVDSSVGGKVAVNHKKAKNMIGAFHQPVGVWIDTATLNTLPDREFRSGLAEVVKYGVIMDEEFFHYLEDHREQIIAREPEAIRCVVTRCCRLKADVVEQDEREESGRRAILNYGHTFAHAFETAASYSSWLHGEAVSAGMMCAANLALEKGLIGKDLVARQERLLQFFGLPIAPQPWPVDNLLATMRTDKKAEGGRLRFILPTRLGEVRMFDDVTDAEVIAILERYAGEAD